MKKAIIILLVIAVALLVLLAGLMFFRQEEQPPTPTTQAPTTQAPTTVAPTTVPPTTVAPTTEPTEPPFVPAMTADSDPANWNTTWEIMADGELVEGYQRQDTVFFGDESYFALPGVASFRGGNYRNDATYGTAQVTEGKLQQLWKMSVGWLSEKEWIGCGWTGQPLVVQWDAQTRQNMNLYEDKKAKDGLVEVIYAKMDGRIHFFDIEDGSATRDPMYVGMVFKGSGALDPRGYPILYVGAGLAQGGKQQTMFIINLIDCTIAHEISGYDNFALRHWYALDSSPLVDAETDTLFWPGESGIFYSLRLNAEYDRGAGLVHVAPDQVVKTRYTDDYHKQGRYLGYESSLVAVEGYGYLGDNAGMLHCVDLNTMELVWAQDILDDINSTPVFDWGDDGNGYLYTAPSLDYLGYRHELPICKVDARTGQILWTHKLECVAPDGISSGTLASPLLGRAGTDLQDIIVYSVGRTPSAWKGTMVALNKHTGKVVWEFTTANYMWSSPVAVYTDEGKSYIFQTDASGNCYLLDGLTGQQLDLVCLGSTVEASPVVYGDRVVLGTRSGIYLFKVK